MNYYVIWPDGRRFGPADLATLNAWAMEGRLIPASQLEDAASGRRFPAHELPGLAFPAAGPTAGASWSQPQSAGYYRPPYGVPYGGNSGQALTAPWVLGTVALLSNVLCCCSSGVLSVVGVACGIVGMVLANNARRAGDPRAYGPWVYNLIATVVSGAILVLGLVLQGIVSSGALGR